MPDIFAKFENEFLKFEKVENKLSLRPDLHAFILLDRILPGTFDLISDAKHDEIFLEVEPEALAQVATEEQLLELHRCGVRHDTSLDSLAMFV